MPDKRNAELELSVTGSSGWGSVSNSPPGEWIRGTYELSDTVSYTRGKHNLAVGFEFTPYTNKPGVNQSSPASFGVVSGTGSPRIAQVSVKVQF